MNQRGIEGEQKEVREGRRREGWQRDEGPHQLLPSASPELRGVVHIFT